MCRNLWCMDGSQPSSVCGTVVSLSFSEWPKQTKRDFSLNYGILRMNYTKYTAPRIQHKFFKANVIIFIVCI